ncbi:MAG TPA: DegT/DnrJ/EryC1/StrS family aminotransferase [Pirellulaceae bacterium]|jgi:perosamine synthetase|nr:DegT/DnrJ/EryC1/StrS family aminotransferase [Pirellulaceae bacterium]
MRRIPVAGPSITSREIEYVADAAARCWYDNAGEYNQRFEKAFAEYVGVRFAMSLPSCTSALHLSLAAADVGPGDEVIVPDVTWIASSAPISYVGATPVFADIDATTWCLSLETVKACVTDRTRAIIAVDLYGSMPDLPAIRAFAEDRGIVLIEDAAEAFGSEIGGRKAGSFGVTGTFSFHGSKTMTTGEGGMLVTDDEAIFRRASFLRDHGRIPGDVSFRNSEIAFKYKMSAVQAALGLAQVERAEELVAKKREIFGWYAEELSTLSGVTLNVEPAGTKNSYWMTTAVLDPTLGIEKRELAKRLSERGVDTRPFFHPLSSLPAYERKAQARLARERNAVSYRISPYGVNLPCAMSIDRQDVALVAAALREALVGEVRRVA